MSLNGPVYHRPAAAPDAELAIFIREAHTNSGGILHGGMMMSFLDVLLGAAARDGCGGTPVVTVQVSVEFHRMVRPGEWLMGKARMTHATRDLVFAEGHAFVGTRQVSRASGVFKLMGQIRHA
jgi:uncharacterized protein (TIGR00369 family)